jgi:hypothetical protein
VKETDKERKRKKEGVGICGKRSETKRRGKSEEYRHGIFHGESCLN